MTKCLKLTIIRVANSGKEINIDVLHRQLTRERAPRTHQTLQGSPHRGLSEQQPSSVDAI
jgi:hypothetical protein